MPVNVPTDAEMHAAINAAVLPLEKRIAALETGAPAPVPAPLPAEIVEAKSGETKDVQEAVQKAPQGSVVRIPEGEWAFPGTVIDERGTPIIGAGKDKTRLIDKNPSRGQFSKPMFLHRARTAKLSGMTVTGMGPINSATVTYNPQSCNLEARDMVIEHVGGAGFTLRNQVDASLIEDVEFRELFTNTGGNKDLGYGVVVYGDPATYDLPELPLVDISECLAKNVRHVVASNEAARYRFSNSEIINTDNMNGAAIDTHADTSIWKTGARYAEITGNKVQATWYGVLLRGGAARVWNNDFSKCGNPAVGVGYDGGKTGVDGPYSPRNVHVWDNVPNLVEMRNGVPRDRVSLEAPEGFNA